MDATQEQQSLLRTDDSSLSFKRSAWIRVGIGSLLFILVGGVFGGFQALKPVLEDENVFSNFCKKGENLPCDAQILQINFIFQFTAGAVNFLAVPLGFLNDHLPKRTFALGTNVFTVISFILIGFSLQYRSFDDNFYWVPTFGFLLLSLAGAGFWFCLMGYMADLPDHAGQINALLTCAWDLSSLILFFFNIAYYQLHLSLLQMFCGYIAIVSLPLFAFSWFINTPKPSISQTPQQPSTEASVNTQASDNISSNKPETEPAPSLRHFLLDKKMITCMLWVASFQLCCYFYMSTVLDQARWITGSESRADTMNFVFSILLPAIGFGSNLIFGKLVSNLRLSFLVLLVMNCIWLATSVIKIWWLQFVTYAVFVPWRIFDFIVLYAYINQFFPASYFGRLASICLSCGGLAQMAVSGLNHLVEYQMDGDFFWMNLAVGILAIGLTVLMMLFGARRDKAEKEGYQPI